MTWVIVLLVLIFAQLCMLSVNISHVGKTIRAASDLNLQAQARLLAHLENIERARVMAGEE